MLNCLLCGRAYKDRHLLTAHLRRVHSSQSIYNAVSYPITSMTEVYYAVSRFHEACMETLYTRRNSSYRKRIVLDIREPTATFIFGLAGKWRVSYYAPQSLSWSADIDNLDALQPMIQQCISITGKWYQKQTDFAITFIKPPLSICFGKVPRSSRLTSALVAKFTIGSQNLMPVDVKGPTLVVAPVPSASSSNNSAVPELLGPTLCSDRRAVACSVASGPAVSLCGLPASKVVAMNGDSDNWLRSWARDNDLLSP
jgi:hypothetical protein